MCSERSENFDNLLIEDCSLVEGGIIAIIEFCNFGNIVQVDHIDLV